MSQFGWKFKLTNRHEQKTSLLYLPILSSNYIKDDIKSKPTLSAEYEIVAVAFELRDKNKFKEHLGACLDWQ